VSTILDKHYVKKNGKYLVITNLGRAVTEWMKLYFPNIEDLKFTAGMEQQLDGVEEGTVTWKEILKNFYYDGFEAQLKGAEEGPRMKVQPTVSDEICPVCGKNLVEKDGKFGPFLACPGYPECTFTMPLVEVMPGRCPKCSGRLMKHTGISKSSGKQYVYYCCEYVNSRDEANKCDFMTWDVPVKDDCPSCGHTMFKKAGKGFKKPYCINEACVNFVPEEKRGYPKKVVKTEEEPAAEKKAEKKTAAKKTAAKKTETKKPAAKKTAKKKEA
jgi:DNA topoisomerase-1